MSPAVEVRNAHKSFGDHKVLDGIDLTVDSGQVTVIVGPSGSGKSTLLRCINHLEPLDLGYVRLDGELVGVKVHKGRLLQLRERAVLRQRSQIGFVFQSYNLFPHMTVLENVMEAPLWAQGRGRAEVRPMAESLLRQVGLGDKLAAYPRHLSGGQQQRVAIARALALQPKLILFDEPTSALDPELVGEVLSTIKSLAHGGTTMIVVTHEIGFAREIADEVVLLDRGRIVEQGPPEEVLDRPQQARTQDFLSRFL
jgi:polar amino acid transport system ATP-binding protein